MSGGCLWGNLGDNYFFQGKCLGNCSEWVSGALCVAVMIRTTLFEKDTDTQTDCCWLVC